VWHSCPRLWLLFVIPSLPAVGDRGQKLADVLDLFFSPGMEGALPRFEKLRGRHLFILNVAGERLKPNAQPLGRLIGGIQIHYGKSLSDRLRSVKKKPKIR